MAAVTSWERFAGEPEPGFVSDGCRLERVALTLLPKLSMGYRPDVVVEVLEQLLESFSVSLLPLSKQGVDLMFRRRRHRLRGHPV